MKICSKRGGPTKTRSCFVQVLFVQSVPPPMLQPKRKPQTSVDRLGHIAYHIFVKAIKQYIIQHHTVFIVYRYTYLAPDLFCWFDFLVHVFLKHTSNKRWELNGHYRDKCGTWFAVLNHHSALHWAVFQCPTTEVQKAMRQTIYGNIDAIVRCLRNSARYIHRRTMYIYIYTAIVCDMMMLKFS